jgi:signal transduction histidine kinase/uncharacterized membrane protein affecting hemolysin expression/ActR/RegA family two-component response regulator
MKLAEGVLMKRRSDAPIQKQLMTVIVLTSAAVLTLTWAIFISYELYNLRRAVVLQLSTLSAVTARNSTAALAFDDAQDAAETLKALSAERRIVVAALYDRAGKVFARYPQDASEDLPPSTPPDGYHFEDQVLIGVEPVVEGAGHRLGTLYVEADMRFIRRQLLAYTGMAILGLAGALLLAYFISKLLQRRISSPILALAETARAVSERRDYSVRAERADGAELGALTDAFNQMLSKVQGHETTLRENAQRQRMQLDRLDLLNRITRAIGERQDLPSIFRVVLHNLDVNLSIDVGCVLLHTENDTELQVAGVRAKAEFASLELVAGETRLPLADNLQEALRGSLIYEPDLSTIVDPFARLFLNAGLRSLVKAPLAAERNVFGVLIAARAKPDSFTADERDFLRQLSEHVALAAHQARLYGDLQLAYEEVRQSQQVVMQQERLKALGQIASGVAHDINNAISPISLYAEALLEREPNLTDRGRRYLITIQRAIGDVAGTVSRMREFYRQREPQLVLARIALNEMVKQAVELTRPRWSDMPQERGIVVKLSLELAPDLPDIMGAEGEIRDALTNLIFNAVDAMPDGGTLTVRTGTVANETAVPGEVATASVYLAVTDTGIGMDEETRRRCLEPFYTTKGERGTGLGLSMVFGMVQRHSAELAIESAVGVGTTVRLTFAAAGTANAPAARVPGPRQAVPLNLLIVDDDPLITESLNEILIGEGNSVTIATGGQEGIDMFMSARQRHEPFDAVITDLGMPYVDGRRVAAAVKAASPGTPVILLTGWAQRLRADNEIPRDVDKVLNKPPRLRELRALLGELAPRQRVRSSV